MNLRLLQSVQAGLEVLLPGLLPLFAERSRQIAVDIPKRPQRVPIACLTNGTLLQVLQHGRVRLRR
jgi:hypothetical protein